MKGDIIMIIGWAVFLRGARVSPIVETEAQARSWARCYYDIDNDDVTIDKCYEGDQDE